MMVQDKHTVVGSELKNNVTCIEYDCQFKIGKTMVQDVNTMVHDVNTMVHDVNTMVHDGNQRYMIVI